MTISLSLPVSPLYSCAGCFPASPTALDTIILPLRCSSYIQKAQLRTHVHTHTGRQRVLLTLLTRVVITLSLVLAEGRACKTLTAVLVQ